MSRPPKRGLDYFPHDTDTDDDSALAFIEAKYALDGYAVYMKLLERIYGKEGYWMPWDDRERALRAKAWALDSDRLEAIVMDCVVEGLFDAAIFTDYGVLTSHSVQERYVEATKRRADCSIRAEFMLTLTPLLHAKSTQTKGNEIRGDEKTSPLSADARVKGIDSASLGRYCEKNDRTYDTLTDSEIRGLRGLCNRFSGSVVSEAIGQAFVQIHEGTSNPRDLFAFIATIAEGVAS